MPDNRFEKLRSPRRRRAPPPPITSNFWPAVKEALNLNSEQATNMDVPCLVCRATLKPGEKTDEIYCYGITMMACGHFLGKECAEQLMGQPTYNYKCPQCLKDLYHPGCMHLTRTVPIEDFNLVKDCLRARVLGGGEGGVIPFNCVQCSKVPAVKKLTADFYRRLTNHERDMIGDTLIFTLLDSWDYVANYKAVLNQLGGGDGVHVMPWDEDPELSDGYCHYRLLNTKTGGDLEEYAAYATGAWAPSWVNTYVGLPYEGERAEAGARIFEAVIPSLPDLNVSPVDQFM